MVDVLSRRALNRALLARQMLLERSATSPASAIGHLVGMQAQVPTDPYIGLWSRLDGFRLETLEALLESRKAVRIAAMRGTVHLLLAEDALALRPLTQVVFDRAFPHTPFGKGSKGADAAAVVAAARKAVHGKAMTLVDLRKVLAPRFPEFDAAHLSYLFHYAAPLVQVPPRGLWSKGGAPKVTTLDHWLGRPMPKRPSIEKIVLRYLAAFGPASVMDAQGWSGLTKLAPVFETLRKQLVTFADDTGRELFDLPDAPRPDEDTPAPPRFLPVYDNVTLGFANRDRIINAKPKKPPADNAWVKSFTIDGFVAGFWKVEAAGKKRATLKLEPFGKLAKKDERALIAEGRRLLKFVAPKAEHAVETVA
jgi:hypothetical protein